MCMTCGTDSYGHQPRPLTKTYRAILASGIASPACQWLVDTSVFSLCLLTCLLHQLSLNALSLHLPSRKVQQFARVQSLTMLGLSLFTAGLKDADWGTKSEPCQGQGTALTWLVPSIPGDGGHTTRGMPREQGADGAWEGAPVPALTPGEPGSTSTTSPSPAQQAGDELLETAETEGKWHRAEAEQGL